MATQQETNVALFQPRKMNTCGTETGSGRSSAIAKNAANKKTFLSGMKMSQEISRRQPVEESGDGALNCGSKVAREPVAYMVSSAIVTRCDQSSSVNDFISRTYQQRVSFTDLPHPSTLSKSAKKANRGNRVRVNTTQEYFRQVKRKANICFNTSSNKTGHVTNCVNFDKLVEARQEFKHKYMHDTKYDATELSNETSSMATTLHTPEYSQHDKPDKSYTEVRSKEGSTPTSHEQGQDSSYLDAPFKGESRAVYHTSTIHEQGHNTSYLEAHFKGENSDDHCTPNIREQNQGNSYLEAHFKGKNSDVHCTPNIRQQNQGNSYLEASFKGESRDVYQSPTIHEQDQDSSYLEISFNEETGLNRNEYHTPGCHEESQDALYRQGSFDEGRHPNRDMCYSPTVYNQGQDSFFAQAAHDDSLTLNTSMTERKYNGNQGNVYLDHETSGFLSPNFQSPQYQSYQRHPKAPWLTSSEYGNSSSFQTTRSHDGHRSHDGYTRQVPNQYEQFVPLSQRRNDSANVPFTNRYQGSAFGRSPQGQAFPKNDRIYEPYDHNTSFVPSFDSSEDESSYHSPDESFEEFYPSQMFKQYSRMQASQQLSQLDDWKEDTLPFEDVHSPATSGIPQRIISAGGLDLSPSVFVPDGSARRFVQSPQRNKMYESFQYGSEEE